MNVIRYNNFTEFWHGEQLELSRSGNEKIVQFLNVVGNLGKGCGCTRKQRIQWSSKEYRDMANLLNPQNVQLLKMKHPMTKIEFAEADEVFYVIDP